MSDEEREALKILKAVGIRCKGINIDEVIINLIEKQQKEIEELKEKNKKYIVQLTDEQYRKLVDTIRSQISKEWEDKIKAKIEEVEQWELYNMKIPRLSTLDERLGAKIGIKYVLQSLLEKE